MLRRCVPLSFHKNFKHLPRSHRLRRWWWVRKLAQLALFGGCCTAASYMRAAGCEDESDSSSVSASFGLVALMELVPLNFAAQTGGYLAGQTLIPPQWHQQFISFYMWWYGISLKGIENCITETAQDFSTAQEFFERRARKDLRPVDASAVFVAPCDATLTRLDFLGGGEGIKTAPAGSSELTVKNTRFSYRNFYRFPFPEIPAGYRRLSFTFNLGPADPHRVVAPSPMRPLSTIHIPGTLLSVSPAMRRWVPTVLVSNERVAIQGVREGDGRLMAIALVGALMHGSIRIPFDERVTTNPETPPPYAVHLKYTKPPLLPTGQEVGYFRWGSAVVFVTDVKDDEEVAVKVGDHVLSGQTLIRPRHSSSQAAHS